MFHLDLALCPLDLILGGGGNPVAERIRNHFDLLAKKMLMSIS